MMIVVFFLWMVRLILLSIIGEFGLLYWKYIFFIFKLFVLGSMLILCWLFFLLVLVWILFICFRLILVLLKEWINLINWWIGEFSWVIIYMIVISIFSVIFFKIIVLVIMKRIKRFLFLLIKLLFVCCICEKMVLLSFVWISVVWVCF